MPTRKFSRDDAKAVIAIVEECLRDGFPPPGLYSSHSAIREAARRQSKPNNTVDGQIKKAKLMHGLEPDWNLYRPVNDMPPPPKIEPAVTDAPTVLADTVRTVLRSGPRKLSDLATAVKADLGTVLNIIDDLASQGLNIHRVGDVVEIPRDTKPSWTKGAAFELVSTPDNKFLFGATGDWHVGSKYFRQDVLDDLYRRFDDAGIQHVFHTGNWIDGEAHFNRYDLDVHGLDAQCRALAKAIPEHAGITTHAVWGDDHEGWYAKREGVDVGRYAEQVLHAEGKPNWHDLGFMEGHVTLRNANTGAAVTMAVVHPGGGSAYALSYKPQKIIESLEGGEKPAVLLLGHYHKLDPGLVRNVWYLQTGCTQDQTPFMRKKSLEAHVGGAIVSAEQDPETGAIIGFAPDMKRYFNRSYYAGSRWSSHAPVDHAPRSIGGV